MLQLLTTHASRTVCCELTQHRAGPHTYHGADSVCRVTLLPHSCFEVSTAPNSTLSSTAAGCWSSQSPPARLPVPVVGPRAAMSSITCASARLGHQKGQATEQSTRDRLRLSHAHLHLAIQGSYGRGWRHAVTSPTTVYARLSFASCVSHNVATSASSVRRPPSHWHLKGLGFRV